MDSHDLRDDGDSSTAWRTGYPLLDGHFPVATVFDSRDWFLRKRLAFYQEHKQKPQLLTDMARWILVLWSRLFDWRNALVIAKPDILISWHRKGFPPAAIRKRDQVGSLVLQPKRQETDYDSLEKRNFVEFFDLSMCKMCAKTSYFWPKETLIKFSLSTGNIE